MSQPVSVDIQSLEKRQLFAAMGINVNNFSAGTYPAIVDMLRASGTKDVRLWYGFDSYGERSPQHIARYAKMFHDDGFDVTLSVNPRGGRTGSYDDARGLFNYLVSDDADLAPYVDRWEIGNEMESQHYWRGTLGSYVSDYLAPASAVLHRVGEKVVSAGVAWNPEDIHTLVSDGMLQYVDYVGYHAYRPSVPALKAAIAAVKSYVGGTPLVASEWNIRRTTSDAAWTQGIKDFWPIIRDNFAYAHYFAAVVQDSQAGPAGVLTESGKPNQPFYRTYFGLNDDGSGDNNGGNNNGGGNSGNGNGSGTDGDGDNSNGTNTGGDQGGGSGSGGTKTTDGDTDNSGGTKTGGTKTETGGGNSGGTDTGGTKTGTVTTPTPSVPAPVVPKPKPPAISSASLLNATRDHVIAPYAVLSGATTVDLASTGTTFLSLLVSANKKTQSVKFTLNGNTVVDSTGGYTLFGEKHGDVVGSDLKAGATYVVTAQPFGGLNATGVAGAITSYTIMVIDSNAPSQASSAAAAAAEAARKRRAAAAAAAHGPTQGTLPGV